MGAAALLCGLAACEGRTVSIPDEGIGFGDGYEGTTDESTGESTGDGSSGEESGDSVSCKSSVDSLQITEATDRGAVVCIEEVVGDLTIGPTTTLADLQLLANLRSVGGTLFISGNLALTSLEGLEQLDSVDWLHLRRNHALADLHGLEGLGWVDRITIGNNDGLVDLTGLSADLSPSLLELVENDALTTLGGLPEFLAPGSRGPLGIVVEDNTKLSVLGGLSDCCADQPVTIRVARNNALVDLAGLEGFARIETLRLYDNVGVQDLGGIDNVTEIGTLEIDYDHCAAQPTPALANLDGAQSLSKVEVLRISWAEQLGSLQGLEGLSDLSKLQIRDNQQLPWADVLDLAEQSGPLVIDACGGVGGPACEPDPCGTL